MIELCAGWKRQTPFPETLAVVVGVRQRLSRLTQSFDERF
jgi:hypothetical protein